MSKKTFLSFNCICNNYLNFFNISFITKLSRIVANQSNTQKTFLTPIIASIFQPATPSSNLLISLANNNLEAAPAGGGILGGPTLRHHPQFPAANDGQYCHSPTTYTTPAFHMWTPAFILDLYSKLSAKFASFLSLSSLILSLFISYVAAAVSWQRQAVIYLSFLSI